MPSPKPCCERDHDRDGNCDRHPPSELPAVQAEECQHPLDRLLCKSFVDESGNNAVAYKCSACGKCLSGRAVQAEVPPAPVMWVLFYRFHFSNGPSEWLRTDHHDEKFIRMCERGYREMTPPCDTQVYRLAAVESPSAPTDAGEMPELAELFAELRRIQEWTDDGAMISHKDLARVYQLRFRLEAHYAQPKPTGMTREVEELVVHHRSRKAFMSLSELVQWLDGQDRLVEAIAVRAAGGGA